MKTGEACNRTVIVVDRDTSLGEAASLMREHHVGSLVVVEKGDGRVPVGIVTDRDMVVEVFATDLDHRTIKVGEIMGATLVTAREEDDSLDTLKLMRANGVRRIPVVTAKGELAGIITVDDLLEIVAEQLDDIVRAIGNEQSREGARRP
jgi:CBS domain-containing protein